MVATLKAHVHPRASSTEGGGLQRGHLSSSSHEKESSILAVMATDDAG